MVLPFFSESTRINLSTVTHVTFVWTNGCVKKNTRADQIQDTISVVSAWRSVGKLISIPVTDAFPPYVTDAFPPYVTNAFPPWVTHSSRHTQLTLSHYTSYVALSRHT